MPSLVSRLTRLIPGGALISVTGLYLGVVLSFVLNIVTARILGTTAFGHVAMGLALLNLLAVAAQGGLSQSSSRFIGEYLARNDNAALRGFIRIAQWVPILTGLTMAGVGLLVVNLWGFPSPVDSVVTVSLVSVPALGSLLLSQNIARGFGRMVLATLPVPVLLPAFALLSFAAGPYAPADATGFMIWYGAITLTLMVSSLLFLVFSAHIKTEAGTPVRPSFHDRRRWLKVSWPMFVTALGQQFMRRADVLILAVLVAPQTLGLYALGARFAQIVAVARYGVNRYSMPQIARSFASGDLDHVASHGRHANRIVLLATSVVVVGLVVAGDPVLQYAGDIKGTAYVFMLILLAGQVAASFHSEALQTLQMCGYERTANGIVLISVPLLFIIGSITTAVFGAIGMAISVSLLTAWQFWFAAHNVRNFIGVDMSIWIRSRKPPGGTGESEESRPDQQR